jgi:hypothetical protein
MPQHKGLNNRAGDSHQPTRRRERMMKRFKSPRQVRRLASDPRQWTERRDGGQDFLEQTARYHDLGHLERDGPAVAHDLGADLDQPIAQRRHRSVVHLDRQGQCAEKVGEIVGQRVQLQPDGVGGEAAA